MQSWNWRPLNQRYTYKDADGRELYQVVRIKRPDGSKTFYRCHHDENGNEVKGWNGLQQVPYRLETFRENNTGGFIFCEGEKDVDRLISLGLPATGVAGGANGISPLLKKQPMFFNDYFSSFKGAIVIPDNDDPGREYANQVSSELSKLGIDVVQSMLPDYPMEGMFQTGWMPIRGQPQTNFWTHLTRMLSSGKSQNLSLPKSPSASMSNRNSKVLSGVVAKTRLKTPS